MSKFHRYRKPTGPHPIVYRGRRRRATNPRFKTLLMLVLIVIGIFVLRSMFSSGEDVSAEATINIRRGVLEFSLDGENLWTRGTTGQAFLEGDRLRCMGNCEASVEILDGGTVFVLAPNTEISFIKLRQKDSGEKNVSIQMDQGMLWGIVADNEFSKKNSLFLLTTAQSELEIQGGIFNLSTGEEDLVRVLRGGIELRATLPDNEKSEPLSVSVGQQLLVDSSTRELFLANDAAKALEPIDSSFEESEWNLTNLEQFRSQEAAEIRHRIEKNASPITQDPSKNGLDSPVIQLPVEGTVIPASQDMLQFEGTAPADAYIISVNGYPLTKFQPGDRKWSYFASKKFGTLVPGENTFEVVSISQEGKESSPAVVTVFYEATNEPIVVAESVSDFPIPVIQAPALSDATQTFETSEPVLVISGIVDPRTVAVEVNGFRLTKYQAGDTVWRYTANAEYGNMAVGENIYTVIAIGPEGEQSSTMLRVNYTPQ